MAEIAAITTPGWTHLHHHDYPHTLRLLTALVGFRNDHERLGYRPSSYGAHVNWGLLENGPMSSTESAVAGLIRSCAILERAGGCPPRLAGLVAETVWEVCGA